jgi:hypothetical protein
VQLHAAGRLLYRLLSVKLLLLLFLPFYHLSFTAKC